MENIFLINSNIHQESKLKKEEFLERVRNVKKIRVSEIERNFFPQEPSEWEILEELHKAVNNGLFKFGIQGHKIFALEINDDLYNWFLNNELQTIQKQVINWIAAVYLSRPDLKEYFEDAIYAPVLLEAKRVIDNFYSRNYIKKYEFLFENVRLFDEAFNGEKDILKKEKFEEFEKLNSSKIETLYNERGMEYFNASLKYINCPPPNFLKNPIEESNAILFDDYGLKYSQRIKIKLAYFNESDWTFIVERDKNKAREFYSHSIKSGILRESDIDRMIEESEWDTLERAESDKNFWDKWLFSYRNYEKTNSFMYKLIDDNSSKGLVYIIRQRNTNYFKIGYTEQKNNMTEKQSVETRIASLQTGNPEPLDIIGYFKVSGTKTEKTLHSHYESKRRTGEWFLLSEKDWQNILNDDWRINNNIF
ncbi:T5orf172 domain-containing protein [Mariniphaga anaerophila]|uniref:T5orf172 domain-containing protein n=1 Tax=Mariniphaga anaerophila TaxID=1484053 RepID=A0A1M5GS01_9BACT|nr:GIY-YIG nuclease family protein [Mariniphaga anaerophila]SHG06506.1 T5orf172 domain-containing protein [Mariniphaga anaerophila]